jgi:hypothetical protein
MKRYRVEVLKREVVNNLVLERTSLHRLNDSEIVPDSHGTKPHV